MKCAFRLKTFMAEFSFPLESVEFKFISWAQFIHYLLDFVCVKMQCRPGAATAIMQTVKQHRLIIQQQKGWIAAVAYYNALAVILEFFT